jgi:hypothetical protein
MVEMEGELGLDHRVAKLFSAVIAYCYSTGIVSRIGR